MYRVRVSVGVWTCVYRSVCLRVAENRERVSVGVYKVRGRVGVCTCV